MKGHYIAQSLIVTVGFFLLSSVTFSCTFVGGSPPPCAIYPKAEMVFEAIVAEIREQVAFNQSGSIVTISLSVEKQYKGDAGKIISIQTTSNMCEYQYEKGKKYLLYVARTSKDKYFSLRTKNLATEDNAKFAKADYEFLQSLTSGESISSIHGFVYEWRSDPIKGVLITVEGDGKIYKTATRKDGYFSVPGIQPGTYKVRCTVPAPTLIVINREEMKAKKPQNFNIAEIEVTVTKDSCSYTEFQLFTSENK